MAVILARLGWAPPLDSLYAEDGRDFLGGALNDGFGDALFNAYTGYLHVVPRLVAEPASWVSIDLAPEVLALEAAAVVVLCAFVVWWTSAGHLRDPLSRALLAALVVFLPVVGFEALASIAHLQWFMLLPAFWLLLWRPSGFGRALAGGSFLALALASAPVGFVLAPLAALRALAVRDRRDLALLGGFAVGAAAQLITIGLDHSTPYVSPGFGAELFELYPQRVMGGAALGQNINGALWVAIGGFSVALLAAAFVALIVFVARRPGPERALSLVAIALSVLAFLIPGYQRDLAEHMTWPAGDWNTAGSRYTIFPVLLLITAVLLQLERRPAALSQRVHLRRRVAALAAISVVALSAFYVGDAARSTPRWSDELPRAREACTQMDLAEVEVPTAPTTWVVLVPCDKL